MASIVTWKFQDALPLYRQEKIFSRHGIELPRATLSRWVVDLGKRCQAIVEGIHAHIRAGPMIGMDETPVQVLKEENRADTSLSYMWVARGGTPGKTAIAFSYHPTRSASVPKEYLSSYTGILQSDGYEAYDAAIKDRPIVHVGCMVHARRLFVNADKAGKIPTSAKTALDYFKRLYAVEREASERNLDANGRSALRKEKALPILIEFKVFLDERSTTVPPESLIGKAIAYSQRQWEKLVRYVDYGMVPIDNNLLENAIRPFVVGRKNFLFSGSPDGASSSAALYTIIETAKANGHEPFHYLYYLFSLLPSAQDSESIQALLPFNCSPAEVRSFVAHHWLGLGS
jgi:transposase